MDTEYIELLHQLLGMGNLAESQARMSEDEPFRHTTFIDTLILTSLSRCLSYIDRGCIVEDSDHRTRFYISGIKNHAYALSFQIQNAFGPNHSLNYNYPLAFDCTLSDEPSEADRYAFLKRAFDHIEKYGNFPDDIDSTYSALYAIESTQIPGNGYGAIRIAKSLLSLERIRSVSNPAIFNTWFADGEEWKSIDPIALSAIASFIDRHDETYSAELKEFIFQNISPFLRKPSRDRDSCNEGVSAAPLASGHFSEFYHSMPMALYLLSRCIWPLDALKALLDCVYQMIRYSSALSVTDSCLSISALWKLLEQYERIIPDGEHFPPDEYDKDLGHIQSIIIKLLNGFSLESNRAADHLYIHSISGNVTIYASSQLFSNIILWEAAFGFDIWKKKMASRQSRHMPEDDAMGRNIYAGPKTNQKLGSGANPKTKKHLLKSPYHVPNKNTVRNILKTFDSFGLFEEFNPIIEQLLKSKDFMICLHIQMALAECIKATKVLAQKKSKGNDRQKIAKERKDKKFPFQMLLTTHAFGLFAYYVYDKIYDREISPDSLPALIYGYRIFSEHLHAIFKVLRDQQVHIPKSILNILTKTDIFYFNLNGAKCLRPKDHAAKSVGICLIPIISLLCCDTDAKYCSSIISFFEHYCAARQISDDAKDECADTEKRKKTTLSLLDNQRKIESAIFFHILEAKKILDSLQAEMQNKSAPGIQALIFAQKILIAYLDDFAELVIKAKFESEVIGYL